MTTVSDVALKILQDPDQTRHDIAHLLKVWAFARQIGLSEHLDKRTQSILETAALLHDIACPLCRKKYGNTNGKHQEEEGKILGTEFLKDMDFDAKYKERVVYLISHHHTLTDIHGMDYQILIEADFLVNADESDYSEEVIRNEYEKIFRTKTGRSLLKNIYLRDA